MRQRNDKLRGVCSRLQDEFLYTNHINTGESVEVIGVQPHYHNHMIIVIIQNELMCIRELLYINEKNFRKDFVKT